MKKNLGNELSSIWRWIIIICGEQAHEMLYNIIAHGPLVMANDGDRGKDDAPRPPTNTV